MRRMVGILVAVAVLGGAPAAIAGDGGDAASQYCSGAAWKLFRGLTNVVTGLPAEMATHAGGGAFGPGTETIGASVTGFLSGLVVGGGYGLMRFGSGIVDALTFPIPFDDNRPLVEPEFKL